MFYYNDMYLKSSVINNTGDFYKAFKSFCDITRFFLSVEIYTIVCDTRKQLNCLAVLVNTRGQFVL